MEDHDCFSELHLIFVQSVRQYQNGIPVSCVGGKKEIMDCIRGNKVLVPGTYPGYGLGMAAVLATLDELTKDDCAVYKQVFKVQEKIMDGLVEISRKYGYTTYNYGSKWSF